MLAAYRAAAGSRAPRGLSRLFSRSVTRATADRPWERPLEEEEFALMRRILAAPSPVGLEAAMTQGVLAPALKEFAPESWRMHSFVGQAGIAMEAPPASPAAAAADREGEDGAGPLTLMYMGHADKIRCQVRSVSRDGKVYIDADSHLPLTLLGNRVTVFCNYPESPSEWRRVDGGTVEALGAIHFSSAAVRQGTAGVKKQQLYVELHTHGEDRRAQVERMGIRPGDPILLDRPIERGVAPDTFSGAYLDNGLGCYVVTALARELAAHPLRNLRCLFAYSSFEEIGRFGSRVMASSLRPDALIAVDVSHDYEAAPGVADQRFPPTRMGEGFTVSRGSVASEPLNGVIREAATAAGIPHQVGVCGRDTGTDAMAGVLASHDCAVASVGVPVRNMHTVSEVGHTGDVLAAVHGLASAARRLDAMHDGTGATPADLRAMHPRLDLARPAEFPWPSSEGRGGNEDRA